MPTFVSLSKPSRLALYAQPLWNAGVVTEVVKSKWGLQVSVGADFDGIHLLSGKEAGQLVQELGPTQRGRVSLGSLHPKKYQTLVTLNPALQAVATVQAPMLVEPGELVQLDLFVQAHKAVALKDMGWLCRLYLIE